MHTEPFKPAKNFYRRVRMWFLKIEYYFFKQDNGLFKKTRSYRAMIWINTGFHKFERTFSIDTSR
jgi:hypothetical protein